METKDLQGKLVAVLGYGIEGKAVTSYLLKQGIKPTLFDEKPWEEWGKEEQDEIKKLKINFIFGPAWLSELKGFDVAFRSPGIRLSTLSPLPSTLITSQAKWFFEHCPAKIIGVTGTKGKGTTSALIYEMLSQQTKDSRLKSKVYLTGNIGKIQPLEILESLSAGDYVVYELSSFQLQDLNTSPHIGVVLMTTSEHLDYHKDQAEYLEAKASITKFQKSDDVAVINADYENSVFIGKQGEGRKLYFSRQKEADCFVKGDSIALANSDFSFPTANLQLRGAHNLENVCAAILAAHSAGVSDDAIKKAAAAFKGLEHRLEFVAAKSGIKFYNDSFSTTPETAIAALNSFNEPKIIILGGSSKNSDFSQLAKAINKSLGVKAIILIGQEAGRIKASLEGKFTGQILEGAKNMEEIFGQIKSSAAEGDVVLLSPACASFDMFKNYKDRGEQFKNQVTKW